MRPLPANIHAVQIVTEVPMVPSVSFLAQGGEAGNRRYGREVPCGRSPIVSAIPKTELEP